MGKVYGYVRVSSTDQHEDRQIMGLSKSEIWFRATRKEVFRQGVGTSPAVSIS